ncbi:MAG: site-specific DNA-methyltransferase [Clostridiales bacterium]|nr:site-specific DNA-methyltransferase [Clostridiales bacterium]
MSLIMQLPKIMEESRKAYEQIIDTVDQHAFAITEIIGKADIGYKRFDNIVARGDNLQFMKFLIDQKDLKGKINLIYIDPPFFSKNNYRAEIKLKSNSIKKIPMITQKAYYDAWEKGMQDYLKMLTIRLLLMKDLLSENGSIWIHLDWHAVHYVKIIMDEIFGEENFINEIIWHYKSGGASKRRFARKHDTLLFYSKSKDYYFLPQKEKSYNRDFKPYRFKGVKEYRDEFGWYTMVNRKDVWMLDMVGRTSAERTGYVTQKPESLIRRILESCTVEGDICADFFGGSGTLAATANKMGRKWISCDIGKLATLFTHKRLVQEGADYVFYEERNGDKDQASGKIDVDVSLNKSHITDMDILRVELKGYRPESLDDIPVEPKYLPVIEKIIEDDPLQFVAYWSVDYNYQGDINRPDACFCKDNKGIETVYETIGLEFGDVGIKVVDIFGNSSFTVVKIMK